MTPSNQSQEVVGTPMCDAAQTIRSCDECGVITFVDIDFARSLERSLIAKNQECDAANKRGAYYRSLLYGCSNHGLWEGLACIGCLEQERDQLKAHVERLRIALALWDATFSKYKSWIANDVPVSQYPKAVAEDYEEVSKVTWPILDVTPSESLAEYRNKVIEECSNFARRNPNSLMVDACNRAVIANEILSLRTTETKKGS